jgi:hypothetical protein
MTKIRNAIAAALAWAADKVRTQDGPGPFRPS